MSESDVRHVVLVKPGDLLVFGNVGEVDVESVEALNAHLHERLGIEVVLFAGDIDMAAVSRGDGG
jgi:hypothetical protein